MGSLLNPFPYQIHQVPNSHSHGNPKVGFLGFWITRQDGGNSREGRERHLRHAREGLKDL